MNNIILKKITILFLVSLHLNFFFPAEVSKPILKQNGFLNQLPSKQKIASISLGTIGGVILLAKFGLPKIKNMLKKNKKGSSGAPSNLNTNTNSSKTSKPEPNTSKAPNVASVIDLKKTELLNKSLKIKNEIKNLFENDILFDLETVKQVESIMEPKKVSIIDEINILKNDYKDVVELNDIITKLETDFNAKLQIFKNKKIEFTPVEIENPFGLEEDKIKNDEMEDQIKTKIKQITEEIKNKPVDTLDKNTIKELVDKKKEIEDLIEQFKQDFAVLHLNLNEEKYKNQIKDWNTELEEKYKPIKEKDLLLNPPAVISPVINPPNPPPVIPPSSPIINPPISVTDLPSDLLKDLSYENFLKEVKTGKYAIKLLDNTEKGKKIGTLLNKHKTLIYCAEIEEKEYNSYADFYANNIFSLTDLEDIKKIPKKDNYLLLISIAFTEDAKNKENIIKFLKAKNSFFVEKLSASDNNKIHKFYYLYNDAKIYYIYQENLSEYDRMYDEDTGKIIFKYGSDVKDKLIEKIKEIMKKKEEAEELKDAKENAKKLDEIDYKELVELKDQEMPTKDEEIKNYLKEPLLMLKEIYEKMNIKKDDNNTKSSNDRQNLNNLILFLFAYLEFKESHQYLLKENINEYKVTKKMDKLYQYLKEKGYIDTFFTRLKEDKIISNNDFLQKLKDSNILSQLHFDEPENLLATAALGLLKEYVNKKKLVPSEDKKEKLNKAKDKLKKDKNEREYNNLIKSIRINELGIDSSDISLKGQLDFIKENIFLYEDNQNQIKSFIERNLEKEYKLAIFRRMKFAFKTIIKLYISVNKDIERFFKKLPNQKCIGFRSSTLDNLRFSDVKLTETVESFYNETKFKDFILHVLQTRKYEKMNNQEFKEKFSDIFYKKIITMDTDDDGKSIKFGNEYTLFKIYKKNDQNFYLRYQEKYSYKEDKIGNLNDKSLEQINIIKDNIKKIFEMYYDKIINEKIISYFEGIENKNYDPLDYVKKAYNLLKREWLFDNKPIVLPDDLVKIEKIENEISELYEIKKNDPSKIEEVDIKIKTLDEELKRVLPKLKEMDEESNKKIIEKISSALFEKLKSIYIINNDKYSLKDKILTIKHVPDGLFMGEPTENIGYKIDSEEEIYKMVLDFYDRAILDIKASDLIETDDY